MPLPKQGGLVAVFSLVAVHLGEQLCFKMRDREGVLALFNCGGGNCGHRPVRYPLIVS